ncbi:MAG: winged helix-turn-helix domain-containing protein [Maritimibacter sp.]
MGDTIICNQEARALWQAQNLIGCAPKDPLEVIKALGFVQIDTIRNVIRAQDHIMWTRLPTYREEAIWPHLEARALFEHFTHDASLIHKDILPHWAGQFHRLGSRAARASWYQSGLGQKEITRIKDRILAEGPLSTRAFDSKIEGPKEMWARPPHKKALDQMWYAGELGTSHRAAFEKYYDLGSRIFDGNPALGHDDPAHQDVLHSAAITRLGFGTKTEIKQFWDATTTAQTTEWIKRADLEPIKVETADGSHYAAFARPDWRRLLEAAPTPGKRLRILNPFDPLIRDRTRLERLYGLAYRNEMFVPPAKRQYGYYVYPVLEGDRFVARLELKADRKSGAMRVTGYWPEPGVRTSKTRAERLDAELDRMRRMAGLQSVEWACLRG